MPHLPSIPQDLSRDRPVDDVAGSKRERRAGDWTVSTQVVGEVLAIELRGDRLRALLFSTPGTATALEVDRRIEGLLRSKSRSRSRAGGPHAIPGPLHHAARTLLTLIRELGRLNGSRAGAVAFYSSEREIGCVCVGGSDPEVLSHDRPFAAPWFVTRVASRLAEGAQVRARAFSHFVTSNLDMRLRWRFLVGSPGSDQVVVDARWRMPSDLKVLVRVLGKSGAEGRAPAGGQAPESSELIEKLHATGEPRVADLAADPEVDAGVSTYPRGLAASLSRDVADPPIAPAPEPRGASETSPASVFDAHRHEPPGASVRVPKSAQSRQSNRGWGRRAGSITLLLGLVVIAWWLGASVIGSGTGMSRVPSALRRSLALVGPRHATVVTSEPPAATIAVVERHVTERTPAESGGESSSRGHSDWAPDPTNATSAGQAKARVGGVLRHPSGPSSVTRVEVPGGSSRLRLVLPEPNPSTGRAAVFAIELPAADQVTLELCDMVGRRVASRAPERLSAGSNRLEWNPGAQAPGLYFVRVRTESGASAEKPWVIVRQRAGLLPRH